MKKVKWLHLLSKLIWRLSEIILAFTFVLFLLGLWRLSKEPVELKYIAPILAEVLTPDDSNLTIEIDKAYLELALQRGHLLDIKITNLNVYRPDDTILASIPQGNVSLSIWELLKGNFIPTSLYLEKPYLNILISPSAPHSNNQAISDAVSSSLTFIINHIIALNKFEINNGEFVIDIDQQNTSILIPEFDFTMEKRNEQELSLQSMITFYIDTEFTPLFLTGLYNTNNNLLTFEANFKNLDIQKLDFTLPLFKGLQLNTNGQVQGILNLAKCSKGLRFIVDELGFSATLNKPGIIYLPKPLDIYYTIQNMSLKGNFSSSLEQLTIHDSFVDIGGPTAEVSSVTTGIGSFLDTNDFSKAETTFTASVHNMPVLSVPDVWPPSLGPDAYSWVKENITNGMVNTAHFILSLKGEELTAVKGLLDVQNTTVRYMEQMPPIEQVSGKVILQLGQVDIEATQGQSNQLKLNHALLNLTELLSDQPIAHIEIDAEGPLNEAFSLINHPPLYFADEFHIIPQTTSGQGEVNLILDFPLDENIALKDIKTSTTATLKNVAMPLPQSEFEINDGLLNLVVTNDELTINGSAIIDNQFETLISCTQPFTTNNPYNLKCHAKTQILGGDLRQFSPALADIAAGPMDIDLVLIQKDLNETELNLSADLTQTTLNLWPISYIKNEKDKASLSSQFIFKDNHLLRIPSFTLTAQKDNVEITGNLELEKNIELHLKKIKAPRNEASIFFKKDKENMITLDIKGKALNLTEVAHGRWLNEEKTPEEVQKEQSCRSNSFTGTVILDKLYLAPLSPLTNIQVHLIKKDNIWQKIDAIAYAEDEPISFKLNSNKKELLVRSDNIGKILKQTGYTSRIDGGKLRSTIKQDDKGTLTGTVHIQKYHLSGVNFLMKAATILGILDAFTGESITFKEATIPFVLTPENVLTIKDAVASGTSLGLTLNGTVTYDEMNFKGSIIPAYAINSLPGKIPFIGRLFSGDKGGGLFGVSFEATGSPRQPEISFNPTSILTPGIIRNIFN